MSTDTVKCPKCGYKVPITEVLTEEIENSIRKDIASEWQNKEKQYEKAIEEGKRAADESLRKVKLQLETKLREEIKSESAGELKELQESLELKTEALTLANEREIQFRREKRDLEEREANLKLEVERTLDREKAAIFEKASREADIRHQMKDSEKDKKLSDALLQVENLKRKMEQNSQQTQGEVFELKMEEMIRAEFPFDTIEEISKGVKGGDILQVVRTRNGFEVGKILWELKRTQSFNEMWITKLKSDARSCKSDLCLLVSEVLPKGITEFSEIEGVWCSSISASIPLAHALRETLLKVAGERSAQSGKKEKADLIYEYIISVEFRGRIEAIVEAFRSMKEDLESEKRAMERIFAKREKQISQVVLNIAGMHGDLASLAGSALPTIKILELPGS